MKNGKKYGIEIKCLTSVINYDKRVTTGIIIIIIIYKYINLMIK